VNFAENFASHKYINLTTFRKNGQEVPTPVWFVEMEGKLYVFTGAQTGKSKRIRANGRARVAPSDGSGKPLGEFVPAKARFATDPSLSRLADERYQRKYGFQRVLIRWLNALRGRKDTTVLIELSPESM